MVKACARNQQEDPLGRVKRSLDLLWIPYRTGEVEPLNDTLGRIRLFESKLDIASRSLDRIAKFWLVSSLWVGLDDGPECRIGHELISARAKALDVP